MVIDDALKQAFRDARSDDIIKKIVAWGRIEKAGLATSYCVGGRFMHLTLTGEGERLRDLVEADGV